MARICIYCGRALLKGEKCTCPSASERAGRSTGEGVTGSRPETAGSGTSSQPGREPGSGAGPGATTGSGANRGSTAGNGQRGTGLLARWHAWRRERAMKRPDVRRPDAPDQNRGAGRPSAGEPQRASPFSQDARRKARYNFMLRLPSIITRLLKAGRYILRPVDAIRLSVQYPAIQRTLGFLALLAVTAGLTFQSAVRNPQLAAVSGSFTTTPRLLLFVEGMAFGAATMMLLTLFYRLIILFLHRRNYAYQSLFDALSPASLYGGLALLLGFLALQTSLLSAVTMLSVGLSINYLVQYFIIRQLTNMDENHSFILVLFANLLCMSAMGVLISLF